jgi:hypothetical protein
VLPSMDGKKNRVLGQHRCFFFAFVFYFPSFDVSRRHGHGGKVDMVAAPDFLREQIIKFPSDSVFDGIS